MNFSSWKNVFTLVICLNLIWFPLFISAKKLENEKKEILASNISELKAAFSLAKPGDVIIMKDGTWENAMIDFNAVASPNLPITLRAQTPGSVILSGKSKLIFSKPYLIVDGLFFKNGSISKGSVVTFESDSCRLTNTAILDYNPEQFETNYYWIFFRGNYNRLDHCYFNGKNNLNPVIQNDEENSRHNRVDYCYIKDIPYVEQNGREIIRVFGYGHADQTGDDGAYFTIEYNLFERAHGEGTEIVSLKSNNNIVRYNTVRGTRGGLVSRRGKNNLFDGNFIFGENQEGSTGIRVADKNHIVINNYISDVAEEGIRLIAGEYYQKSLTENFKPKKKDLPKYLQVKDAYFAHNTIVNAGGYGIEIGYNYKNQWPDLQMILLPENNLFVNNLIFNCAQDALKISSQDKNPPLDFISFKENHFEGNIIFGDSNNLKSSSGVEVVDPKLSKNKFGYYGLSPDSPLINRGVTSNVKDDVEGKIRDDKKDVGAIEFNNDKPTRHPLTSDEVGPDWISKKKASGEKF